MHTHIKVNVKILVICLLFAACSLFTTLLPSNTYAIFRASDAENEFKATPAPGEPPFPGSPEASTSPTPAKTPATSPDATVNNSNKESDDAPKNAEDVSENQEINKLGGWEWLAAGALGVVVLAGLGWVVMGRRKK